LALSRTPPKAMVMMPGDVDHAMKAARALKMLSESIKSQTEALGQQIDELHQLEDRVQQGRDDLNRRREALDKERKALTVKLAERKALRDQLGREQLEQEETIRQLAKKADDLQDLMSSIEKEEKKGPGIELEPDKRQPEGKKGKLRSFASAKGHIRPPVAGKVIQLFGHDNSKGILISTPKKAQVMAPYDGEVVFAGPFLNYGSMVIIRHSDDFHTLLAGFSKIDASVGQFLLEGEPIGAMGDSESGNRLYMELRQNNRPINPAPWISGLNKYKEQ
ncbi:MAG: peptidoglycan DD-metalloendopeptidase family protein, partial [Pseudomonadota bacterium]|nr:peptidoglycan DD-metalloendopeptidase family protein [Pseudomonadota bacterium]